ncbi:hypothetical protein SULI_12980 [Saccharolobus solfataricus]|uniref:Uncharacterized protein n=1 Tax=Saccharolobus solfataricus TaxID=2287 RepID=A0A0E3KA81_SACSO|nr:hypothetical protein [Saccharolobus solfataricus]AKA74676.1 hypothetical protein SULB_2559 [Saccharolobus solfataricus]AKA77370.1 hypothetical protein SULC_2554 [Saccharolobus solfataricus]AKA80061.1 hypothetical protein SULA_2557 [Saccharolobus solfataricus]AZF69138.1 hypothetical protein SULG_12980 [Saccharolobus solfataricus]AZF71758.1 hypothetical protein SULH_12980 [Saccharolobus solfataricus]
MKGLGLSNTLKAVWYSRKLYANWINVLLNVVKNKIRVVLRHSKTEGICTLPCILEITRMAMGGYNLTGLYFSDGKLYYNGNEVIQDSFASVALAICGFV